jgi:hypothetical protein
VRSFAWLASLTSMPATLSLLTSWTALTSGLPFRRRSLKTCIGHSISQRAASAISCVTAWGAQLTVHYDRKQIILERNEISENLGGQYVELYDFMDRPMEVRWRSFASLPRLQ